MLFSAGTSLPHGLAQKHIFHLIQTGRSRPKNLPESGSTETAIVSLTTEQKKLFSSLSQLCRPQSPLFDVPDVMCTDVFR